MQTNDDAPRVPSQDIDTPADQIPAEVPAQNVSLGDDPAPLPRGFHVVDGTAKDDSPVELVSDEAESGTPASAAIEALPVISAAKSAAPAATGSNTPDKRTLPADADKPSASHSAAGLLASVGTFLSTGADAVRQVSAAKKAHDTAAAEHGELVKTIRDRTEELERRQDIEANFAQIVAEHTARHAAQNAIAEQARSKQLEISQVIHTKNEELARIEAEDAKAVKRTKKAVEKAEGKERSTQESATRLQKRLDDRRAALTAAEAKRDQATEEARAAVKSAADKLVELRAELAELQRNPSANPANYSVRTSQLQTEISDAIDAQRAAENAVPELSQATEEAIAQARKDVSDAQKPVDKAQEEFRVAHNEAELARAELKRTQKLAAEHTHDLRVIIEGHEKAHREQERIALEAEQAALQEQAILDEAEDIHAHPEVSQALAAALAADHAEADELEVRVEALAAAEQEVREQTKASRLKFTAAITAGAAIALIILLAILIL